MAVPFQTPVNEKSFSGLIDAAILATGRPQSLVNAVQYGNMTIRECQSFGLFAQDLIEDVIYPTADAYVWTRPARFRRARTFKYTNACLYPDLKLPGRAQRGQQYYYYAADTYFVFSGVDSTEQIKSAIYYWAPILAYFGRVGVSTTLFPGGPYAVRSAYYDVVLAQWMYLNPDNLTYATTTGVPATDLARQALALHWLVDQWWDLILSGTKAKIWNQAGDNRGPVEYSNYKNMQKLLSNTVGYESEGF